LRAALDAYHQALERGVEPRMLRESLLLASQRRIGHYRH